MMDRSIAARNTWLLQYAMDMTTGANLGQLTPLLDPRASDWMIVAYLTARDILFKLGPLSLGEKVCYGYVAKKLNGCNDEYVAVIRGTYGWLEWLIDGRFLPVRHPVSGTVEHGFWDIYTTLQGITLNGHISNAASCIANLLPDGATITVMGHSLGSTIATYLTFDLAGLIGSRARGCYFASPKTGSQEWCAAFQDRVSGYDLYNYEFDKVPLVPDGLDYQNLPNEYLITAKNTQARIRPGAEAAHHVLCYGAQLDYSYCDWTKAGAIDSALLNCILGPVLTLNP